MPDNEHPVSLLRHAVVDGAKQRRVKAIVDATVLIDPLDFIPKERDAFVFGRKGDSRNILEKKRSWKGVFDAANAAKVDARGQAARLPNPDSLKR